MNLTPCEVCPYKNQPQLHSFIIKGDGPLSSRILFLGEKPHKQEHAFRRPFVGDTGEELNQHYLPLAGLERSEIRVTNAVKCAGNFANPEPWETTACSQHHIPGELAAMPNLEILVLMGTHACSLVPGIHLDLDHGIPRRAKVFDKEYTVFPMYHPAAGIHQTGMIREIRDDFERLKRLLGGEWTMLRPQDEHPDIDYSPWDGEEWIDSALYMGADTETDEGRAYCFTFSLREGTGRLVWADDTHKTKKFVERVLDFTMRGGKVLIHNALFDHGIFEQLGVKLEWEDIIDTMVMAYHRWLPQGLKTLAYRLCGMRMQDYSDLVGPYVELEMYEYLLGATKVLEGRAGWQAAIAMAEMAAWDLEAEKDSGKLYQRAGAREYLVRTIGMPLPESRNGESSKVHRDVAPWKRISRILNDLHKGADVDLGKRWENLPEEMRAECVRACGELPPDSIRLVPRELVVPYACRDADAALRVHGKMLEVGERLRGVVSEEDWDDHRT